MTNLKRYTEAVKETHKAIALNPNYAESYLNLGIIFYYHLKDYRKAIANWEKYLHLVPNATQAAALRKKIALMKKELGE